jgi:hypothetical protein
MTFNIINNLRKQVVLVVRSCMRTDDDGLDQKHGLVHKHCSNDMFDFLKPRGSYQCSEAPQIGFDKSSL